jgi:hypothetical protein
MALTLKRRIRAVQAAQQPDTLEILNPRSFEGPSEEEEQQSLERIAAARRAGHRIIAIEPPRSYE